MSQKLVDAAEIAVDLAIQNYAVVKGTNEPSEVARLVNRQGNQQEVGGVCDLAS